MRKDRGWSSRQARRSCAAPSDAPAGGAPLHSGVPARLSSSPARRAFSIPARPALLSHRFDGRRRMRSGKMKRVFGAALICAALSGGAQAADCPVVWDRLAAALKASVKPAGGPGNGGFDNHMWASVVARDGSVCAVAFSGAEAGDQWPGSRAISAEKANTANSVSVDGMALSSGNLYAGALSGGPFYGLEATHPPATDVL